MFVTDSAMYPTKKALPSVDSSPTKQPVFSWSFSTRSAPMLQMKMILRPPNPPDPPDPPDLRTSSSPCQSPTSVLRPVGLNIYISVMISIIPLHLCRELFHRPCVLLRRCSLIFYDHPSLSSLLSQ